MQKKVRCPECGIERDIILAPNCPVCRYGPPKKAGSSEEEQGSSNPKVTGSSPVSPTDCLHENSTAESTKKTMGIIVRGRFCPDCDLTFETYEFMKEDLLDNPETKLRKTRASKIARHILKIEEDIKDLKYILNKLL